MSLFLGKHLVNIGTRLWQLLFFIFISQQKNNIFFSFWKIILDTYYDPDNLSVTDFLWTSHIFLLMKSNTYYSLFWNGYFALIKFIVNFVTVLLTHFPLCSPSFVLKTSDLIIMELPFKCALTFASLFVWAK